MRHELTGAGWLEGLDLTGQLSSPQFNEMIAKLMATMKGRVKGRSQDEFVYLDILAAAAGLPKDWVFNAIESHLVRYKSRRNDAEWKDPGRIVRIPIDFGMEPL